MRLKTGKARTDNSTNNKLAVQWLNEDSSFASSSVLAESPVLLNPVLRQAPNHCGLAKATNNLQIQQLI